MVNLIEKQKEIKIQKTHKEEENKVKQKHMLLRNMLSKNINNNIYIHRTHVTARKMVTTKLENTRKKNKR